MWRAPRATIARVIATNPRQHVLLLAALGAVAYFAWRAILAGLVSALLDWRLVAGVTLLGAILGVTNLYLTGYLVWWIARRFGSKAEALHVRAALAWSMVPAIAVLVVWAIAVAGLKLGALEAWDESAVALVALLQVIVVGLLLWTLIAAVLMLARVLGLGVWRATLTLALVLLINEAAVVTIRSFLVQPFDIPSGSMEPTFLPGDVFFVSKPSYGYTHYSFPFSPRLFPGRIFAAKPDRGDVAIFRLPVNDSIDFVKRIVGLPGERIQMIEGVLYINGQAVRRDRIDDFITTNEDGSPRLVRQWLETLPNGVSFATLEQDFGNLRDTPVFTVPAGNYFVLGDNRDNSVDSRDMSQVGFIPFENLVGRAQLIYFSVDRSVPTRWPTARVERIGVPVR